MVSQILSKGAFPKYWTFYKNLFSVSFVIFMLIEKFKSLMKVLQIIQEMKKIIYVIVIDFLTLFAINNFGP